MTVPQEAIDAAKAYDLTNREPGRNWTAPPDDQVARLLTGAWPHIAAAERERLRSQGWQAAQTGGD